MKTSVKALIQERLRAKLERKDDPICDDNQIVSVSTIVEENQEEEVEIFSSEGNQERNILDVEADEKNRRGSKKRAIVTACDAEIDAILDRTYKQCFITTKNSSLKHGEEMKTNQERTRPTLRIDLIKHSDSSTADSDHENQILSPGTCSSAKAFLDKRQKRSHLLTPRTIAIRKWLQWIERSSN